MLVKDVKNCEEIVSGDKAILREILSPLKDDVKIGYSMALAKVLPGDITLPHRLKSSEVYYILEGKGEMRIDDEHEEVHEGNVIYIPPNSVQQIKNTGSKPLIFLCIVSPPWKAEDEEILNENV
ncbi:MAG: cupin domain-containing protein [Thermoplasmata archaeon]|nr:cupin domain-containing protein [Thermoplasmata archaeon]